MSGNHSPESRLKALRTHKIMRAPTDDPTFAVLVDQGFARREIGGDLPPGWCNYALTHAGRSGSLL